MASTSASYNIALLNPLNIEYSISFGAQNGFDTCGNTGQGADVSSSAMTLNLSNITPFPPFEAAETDYSFPGSQSANFGFSAHVWGIEDTNSSLETVFVKTGISERTNPSYISVLAGTQYSGADLYEMNYADSCNAFVDANNNLLACETITLDNNYDADIFGHIYGWKTVSADMPANGSSSYRGTLIGIGIYGINNFLNLDIGASTTTNCGINSPAYTDCSHSYIYSVSDQQLISVDFAAKTISGTISLQNHYIISSLNNAGITQLTIENANAYYTPLHPPVQNFSITGTISENSFSGTISNAHFAGEIIGYFYGPQAKEISAIIRILGVVGGDYENSGAWSLIVFNGLKL
tara:strand:- start:124 stop:1176 length:1053 start_codon:yes stop_codon:yes gene_type:complete